MNAELIQQQLDTIQTQQQMILSELSVMRKSREEFDELKDDLSIIAKDIFQTVVIEMDEVSPHLQTGDFLFLLKKMLRNTRNIANAVDKFESLLELLDDGSPIGKELFQDSILVLNDMDQKGYFTFFKELTKVADKIVTHFSANDVKMLGDNIVTILETIRNLSQPDMLHSINNAVSIYKNLDIQKIREYSLWKAFRELNSPDMRTGIGFIIMFLKNLTKYQQETMTNRE